MIVGSEGDAGDLVFLCGILNELPGGPHALLLQRSEVTTLRTHEAVDKLYRLMAELISTQPQIAEFRKFQDGDQIEWHSGNFRGSGFHYKGHSLLRSHVHHLIQAKGIGHNIHGIPKWLTVPQSTETKGKVVVNRTERYQNRYFPWQQIVDHYGSRIVFVGMQYEHDKFCKSFGDVSYRRTDNFFDVARLIAGSDLFIGNQSCANAIAEGLKHNLIQEVGLSIPDCIFKRPNAQHVWNGACELPDVDGSGTLSIPPQVTERFVPKIHITPPGLWQYNGKTNVSLVGLIANAMRSGELAGTYEDATQRVLEENYKRIPEFFRDESLKHVFDVFHEGYANACSV